MFRDLPRARAKNDIESGGASANAGTRIIYIAHFRPHCTGARLEKFSKLVRARARFVGFFFLSQIFSPYITRCGSHLLPLFISDLIGCGVGGNAKRLYECGYFFIFFH